MNFNGTTYFYAVNLQGDFIAILDAEGNAVVTYSYDAWGNPTGGTRSSTDPNANALYQYNPLRYRGYVYDFETGFYYLQSRYYNPETGRFLNADGLVSTGQDLIGHNMFSYCGNNPVNHIDATGTAWKDVKSFFANAWSGIKSWAKNTFGAGSSTTTTIVETETPIIPSPSPITVTTGTQTTQTISELGDSSKPISVYANCDADSPPLSSAGLKVNIVDFTLDASVGLDDIGISGSLVRGDTTHDFGVKINLSKFEVGFEYATAVQWDNTTETAYVNTSINGWAILAAYLLVATGQYYPSASYAFA